MGFTAQFTFQRNVLKVQRSSVLAYTALTCWPQGTLALDFSCPFHAPTPKKGATILQSRRWSQQPNQGPWIYLCVLLTPCGTEHIHLKSLQSHSFRPFSIFKLFAPKNTIEEKSEINVIICASRVKTEV